MTNLRPFVLKKGYLAIRTSIRHESDFPMTYPSVPYVHRISDEGIGPCDGQSLVHLKPAVQMLLRPETKSYPD